jgi:hypothetical protein
LSFRLAHRWEIAMPRHAALAVLLMGALAGAARGQALRPSGWAPPPALDLALLARTLQSDIDWRRREEAALQLGNSGDPRWVGPLATAAAGDPSLRVRQAARDALANIRLANQPPGFNVPPLRPGPGWTVGGLPGDPFADMVAAWYWQFLRRSPEPAGLAAHLAVLHAGVAPIDVQAAIIGSDEYWRRQGSTARGFVRGLYADVLGRSAGPSEVANWLNRFNVTRGNRTRVAREFLVAAVPELSLRRPF